MITEAPIIEELPKEILTQDLGPFFENSYGNKYLYSVNHGSFSKLSAEDVYLDFFGKDHFEQDCLYLFIGTDSGLLLEYMKQKPALPGTRYLFIELPEVLERVSEITNIEDLPDYIAVATLESFSNKLQQFNAREYIYTNSAFSLRSMCAIDAHLTGYIELHTEVQKAMEHAKWITMLNIGNHDFVIKQLQTLSDNRIPANWLENLFIGKTAVLLGVGPSLDEILPWLKERQDDLVIIAVSRAARRLLEADLIPHIVVTLDPSDYSFDVSREMLKFKDKSIFVHGNHASAPLVGQWAGKNYYLGKRFPWPSELNVETIPMSGPTVTQVALTLATRMGFAQVLLGGVDLCYSREGRIYGQTTQGTERGKILGEVPGGVETNGGWQSETCLAYAHAIQVTSKLAQLARKNNCTVVNLAEGAAKIPFVEYIPLEKIQYESLAKPAGQILEELSPKESLVDRVQYSKEILKELESSKLAYRNILRLSKKALKVNANLFSGKAGQNGKAELDRIEKKLNGELATFSRFAKGYGALKFLRIVKTSRHMDDFTAAEETGRLYYQAYVDTAELLIKIVDTAEERVFLRLEEEDESPDFDHLFEVWEQQFIYGRGRVVEMRRPGIFENLSVENRETLERLDRRYLRVMNREEDLTLPASFLTKDYPKLRGQANVLFVRKAADSLKVLVGGLEEDETAKGKELKQLASGYCAELEGRLQDALAHYEKIVAGGSPFALERALTRIAAVSFATQDEENLLLAFECLANISPLYMPKYADLLWLGGNVELSLETYVSYLNLVPNDLLAMIRLGRYYLEAGSIEGGRMAFEYVLEKDPANRTAQKILNEISQLDTCS